MYKHSNLYDFTSQDTDRRKTCIRKKPYLSCKVAEKVCKTQSDFSGFSMRVYKCPYCSYFHITKRPMKSGDMKYKGE